MAIYFIRAGTDGPVKIGKADNVAARLVEMQCDNHVDLILLRQVEGGRLTEAWFHRAFAADRLRGEWFAFQPSMLTADAPKETAAPPSTARPAKRIAPGHILSRIHSTRGASKHVAARLGISQAAISGWLQRGAIPADRVIEAERALAEVLTSLGSEAA
jgi:hypothetical protein